MNPGPKNVQSLSAASETAKLGRVRRVLAQADDSEDEDHPRGDEDGLDDPRSDEADGQGLVLPLRDRIQNDRSSDVRHDQKELQENRQVHDVVLAVLEMYAAGSSRMSWKRMYARIDVTT